MWMATQQGASPRKLRSPFFKAIPVAGQSRTVVGLESDHSAAGPRDVTWKGWLHVASLNMWFLLSVSVLPSAMRMPPSFMFDTFMMIRIDTNDGSYFVTGTTDSWQKPPGRSPVAEASLQKLPGRSP